MKPPGWRADAALALVALIWGSTFVLVKGALDDISTILFLGVRFGIAACVLALLWLRSSPRRESWRGGVLAGVFLYSGYLLQTLGLRETTAAKSGFITALYIPMAPLLSAAVYRRWPNSFESTGVALAAGGVALMTLPDFTTFQVGPGELLTLGCAVAFTAHIVALSHYARMLSPAWLALLQIGTCAAIALSTFWWLEPVRVRWSGQVVMALAVTSLLATALAFVVQTWAQKYTTATRTAVIFSLEPLFAWVTAWLAAGEALTNRAMLGGACILGGILITELKPAQKNSHPSG